MAACGGYLTLRIHTGTLSFETQPGKSWDLLAAIESIKQAGTTGVWTAYAKTSPPIQGCLCALRKTHEAIQEAVKRILKVAQNKGPPAQRKNVTLCTLCHCVYHLSCRDLFRKRDSGMVSITLASGTHFQTIQIISTTRTSPQNGWRECTSVALWKTHDGLVDWKNHPPCTDGFPLGLCIADVVNGGILSWLWIKSCEPLNPMWGSTTWWHIGRRFPKASKNRRGGEPIKWNNISNYPKQVNA